MALNFLIGPFWKTREWAVCVNLEHRCIIYLNVSRVILYFFIATEGLDRAMPAGPVVCVLLWVVMCRESDDIDDIL